MAIFFDTSVQADLDLLHSSVRNDPELDNVVDKVEWEILNYYSQREGQYYNRYSDFFRYEKGANPLNKILVRLVGYDQDNPADSDEDLKDVLRRTIADVVSWVLQNYGNSPGSDSLKLGRFSVGGGGDDLPTAKDWYTGWDNKLKNYDARIANYGI